MTRPPSRKVLEHSKRRSRRSRRTRGTGSGFTLLEATIAMGLLSVGLLGVAAAMLSAMSVSSQSRLRTQASYLAGQQIETFRVTSAAQLRILSAGTSDPSNPIDPDPGDSDTTTFNRRWLIEPDTPETGVFTLTVFVDWVDGLGVTRTAQLRTLLAPS